jgi:hypothetical protein
MIKRTVHLMATLFAVMWLNVAAFAEAGESAAWLDTSATEQTAGRKIVIYYLYVMPRCQTCLNIEAYSKEAIETAFGDELQNGTVEWHAYDTGMPEYEHYWCDFELETKSLVVVEMMDGKQVRWKNCERVWDLVEDKPAFLKYVQDEVRAYLKGD